METSLTTENLLNILIAMKKIELNDQSENYKKYFHEVMAMLEDNYRVVEFIKQQNNLK
mgnify:CR=1 FL=1|tara:strand:- start:457 stop:630 length:174 start_codon:yes stop_codon:yes gene_type:complete